jgi:hypothetical protein
LITRIIFVDEYRSLRSSLAFLQLFYRFYVEQQNSLQDRPRVRHSTCHELA